MTEHTNEKHAQSRISLFCIYFVRGFFDCQMGLELHGYFVAAIVTTYIEKSGCHKNRKAFLLVIIESMTIQT